MSSRAEASSPGDHFASHRPTRSRVLELAFEPIPAIVTPVIKHGVESFTLKLYGLTFVEVEAIAAFCREKGIR